MEFLSEEVFTSDDPDATLSHARTLGNTVLSSPDKLPLVLLEGPLGAGKTLWTRGFAEGLGIHTIVHSPSFSLLHVYPGEKVKLYHLDLYRMECFEEIVDLGLFEMIDERNPCVIEWADKISELQTWDHWSVKISPTHSEKRTINCKWNSGSNEISIF